MNVTTSVANVSRWIIFCILILVTSSAKIDNSSCYTTGKQSSWELIENTEGVKIYLRWIDISNKIKVRERKAEIIIHNSLDKALQAVTDSEKIPLWMSGLKKAMLLHRENPVKWYSYTLYGLPWPFNDREMITLCTLTYSSKKDKVFLNMCSSDESYPPAKGVERLTHYKASWELFEIKPDLVKMTFIARSEDPPVFPRCVQEPVIKKVFYKNMLSLKQMLDGDLKKL